MGGMPAFPGGQCGDRGGGDERGSSQHRFTPADRPPSRAVDDTLSVLDLDGTLVQADQRLIYAGLRVERATSHSAGTNNNSASHASVAV